MEKLKNKGLEYFFLALFVGILSYSIGNAVGRDEMKATFLDSAYISSCDETGKYCYLETKNGEEEISCDKNYRCSAEPSTAEELQKKQERDALFNEVMPSEEETQEMLEKILNEMN